MSNIKTSLLHEQLKAGFHLLEGTMKGVTPEMAHWQPSGKAHSIAATLAHVVTSVDVVTNGLCRGSAPLFATTFAGKTGMSAPQPMPTEDNPSFPNWQEWADTVQINLEEIHEYAKAVYQSSGEYLDSITDADLDQQLQTPIGEASVGFMYINAIIGHTFAHAGEISTLKGLQETQGFPF